MLDVRFPSRYHFQGIMIHELVALQRAAPYRAYRIYLADGRYLDVQHPDFVARSRVGRSIVVYKKDGSPEYVDIRQVTSFEVLNGQRRSGCRTRGVRR